MTVVKICGLTDLEDAQAALDAGAEMLGFNFYATGPRYVATDAVAAIVAALRAARPAGTFRCVGVFVNASADMVRQTLDRCGLDIAQLHGDETPREAAALGSRAYKALRPRTSGDAEMWIAEYLRTDGEQQARLPPAFLFDASHPALYGGTGRTGDWEVARTYAARYPILLAGGLTPSNVSEAVRAVKPWGVDVASGVESVPRKKDAAKMRAFVSAVRYSDNESR